ncbi:MAG TPA: hypothetical protein VFU89_03230 [Rhabdochlamydiaceae bacterium]|nr:hypothetical protein [Rhabdochlamydiaceae bacterium]
MTGGIDTPEVKRSAQAVLQARARKAESKQQPLPSSRVVVPAPTSTNLKKVQKIVTPNRHNLYGRVSIDRDTLIDSAVIGSMAIGSAFVALSAKGGTLAASKLVTANVIAFLKPGITICSFALKTGMFVTMKTIVPVVTGVLMPAVLPVVVSGALILMMFYLVNKVIKKIESSLQAGLTTVKDAVTDLPGTVLRQVPGNGIFTSIFQNKIEKANRASGALAEFEKMRDATTGDQKAGAETAIATLKGEITPDWATLEPSKGLADILEKPRPHPTRSRMHTREYLRAQAKESNA